MISICPADLCWSLTFHVPLRKSREYFVFSLINISCLIDFKALKYIKLKIRLPFSPARGHILIKKFPIETIQTHFEFLMQILIYF